MFFSVSDREAATVDLPNLAIPNPADLALPIEHLRVVFVVQQLGKTPVPDSRAGILSGTVEVPNLDLQDRQTWYST